MTQRHQLAQTTFMDSFLFLFNDGAWLDHLSCCHNNKIVIHANVATSLVLHAWCEQFWQTLSLWICCRPGIGIPRTLNRRPRNSNTCGKQTHFYLESCVISQSVLSKNKTKQNQSDQIRGFAIYYSKCYAPSKAYEICQG